MKNEVVYIVITHEEPDICAGFLLRPDTGERMWSGASYDRDGLAELLTVVYGPRALKLRLLYPTRPDGSPGYILMFIDGERAQQIVANFDGQETTEHLVQTGTALAEELERRNHRLELIIGGAAG